MTKYTHHKITALFFVLPQLLVTLFFFIWPAWRAVKESFFYGDAFGLHRHFAGFDHFIELLHSSDYAMALWVTLVMSVAITGLTMIFGLGLAVLVHGRCKSQGIYKSLLLWPYAVAPAVAAILWRFLCHPTLGWLTALLA